MANFDYSKYRPFPKFDLASRAWPDKVIDFTPRWCSVDLRDGNQALVEPMNVHQKRRMWDLLVKVGFKEIEVGFPSASKPDFDFVRQLIEEDLIPGDVTIQVLTQARDDLIERTFESVQGANRVNVHLYNSTSTVQRDLVFGKDRDGITDIAVHGAQLMKRCAEQYPGIQWEFQYSPESFTGTELDFAVEICNAVNRVWQPSPEHKVINNLPATVELATPNIYADQIEWFCNHIENRDSVVVSVHTHNDRGCAIAASEMGLMAGAQRVEGTLFGNGERTGNVDIITMAMNLYSQGVDPKLDLSRMDEIISCAEDCTQLPIHPRHPYVGELVYSAFSGSHQDAIRKCLKGQDEGEGWRVAYLPIDPRDLGRSYQELIRINSQSGKGGVAYIMENEYNLQLPRWMQIEFSTVVQQQAEKSETEVPPARLWELFKQEYMDINQPYNLVRYRIQRENDTETLTADLGYDTGKIQVKGSGKGVIEAFIDALQKATGHSIIIVEYSEHALGQDTSAKAITYMQVSVDGMRYSSAAINSDIISASFKAILTAVNLAHHQLPAKQLANVN